MAQFTMGAEHAEPAVSSTADPTPLALGAFALTTAILGSIFAGFIVPAVGAGMSILAAVAFFGGLVQLLSGMWDLRRGEMLHGTIFASYGGFLMALGVIMAPSLGIFTALGSAQHAALGLFFLAWTIFSAIIFVSSLRTNIGMIVTLALLFLSYLLLTIGELTGGSTTALIIGGWLGVLTGLVAWYNAFAALLRADRSVFHLPV
jgi:uncharacterized protein